MSKRAERAPERARAVWRWLTLAAKTSAILGLSACAAAPSPHRTAAAPAEQSAEGSGASRRSEPLAGTEAGEYADSDAPRGPLEESAPESESPPPLGRGTTGGDASSLPRAMLEPELPMPSLDGARRDHERLLAFEGDLASHLQLARCPGALDLRDRICDLSERICEIAEANPDEEQVQEQCEDGQARCDRARDSVAGRCP